MPDVLDGKAKPANPPEQIEFAQLCILKRRSAAAVRFFADAFQTDASLANDLVNRHRHSAAGCAARTAADKDEKTMPLDEADRARLRSQALRWLRSDLVAWGKRLDGGKPEDRALVERTMRSWQQDADFVSVRDDALAKLPEAERADWRKLWQNLQALLKRAAAPK